jgi:acyl-CoA thioester hydrolase
MIDQNNHINNLVYLQIGLQAASKHWKHLTDGLEDLNALWVVKRHEIDYIAQAFEGDALSVKTWVDNVEGATVFRFITITNTATQKVICNIHTQWYLLDAVSKRPKRIGDEVKELFGL